ncbi:iron-sulfur cluster assembly accessory protein [Colletotrichum tofieldiae]|uniref:Iron-sulfur cluster assembly accessory protein n=1 Tax=Colletotrichum tofieldiae TaxID=708197 RepID=A0A166Y111_9PEZI|nr:iron-sulfur cluster assembly accessory protein [Colletotrichum tofieldiae]
MPVHLRCIHAPSSANIFVQLARRTTPTSNTPSPILSVLVPRWKAVTTTTTRAGFGASRTCSSEAISRGGSSGRYIRRRVHQQIRAFTASTARRQTRCAWNPKKDEDGQEMKLDITDRAGKACRLSDIMKKDNNPNLALRIQVESGGCHGFQYLMSLVTLPKSSESGEDWSKVVGEDDTVFQYLPDDADASRVSFEGPKVVIDEPSLDLLKGSKVDFTMELIGSQFKITDNPYASSSCGCGTSFDIKI